MEVEIIFQRKGEARKEESYPECRRLTVEIPDEMKDFYVIGARAK